MWMSTELGCWQSYIARHGLNSEPRCSVIVIGEIAELHMPCLPFFLGGEQSVSHVT